VSRDDDDFFGCVVADDNNASLRSYLYRCGKEQSQQNSSRSMKWF